MSGYTDIVVHSVNRQSGSTSATQFSYELDNPGTVTCAKLTSFQWPALYNVSSNYGNDVIAFWSDADSLNYESDPIPAGSYTASTYATALQTALNAAGATGAFTVTYSTTTLKLTITHASGIVEIGHHRAGVTGFVHGERRRARLNLGVAYGSDYATLASGAATTLPAVADLRIGSPTHLSIRQLPSNSKMGVDATVPYFQWTLMKGAADTGGATERFLEKDYPSAILAPTGAEFRTIDVVLYDDLGRVLDSGGCNWSFVLRVSRGVVGLY